MEIGSKKMSEEESGRGSRITRLLQLYYPLGRTNLNLHTWTYKIGLGFIDLD